MHHFLTWDIEKFFRLKHSRLVLINLAEIFVQLLEFLLTDYRVLVQINDKLQLRFLSYSCSFAS